MFFDLQRFSRGKICVRHGGENLWTPLNNNEILTPRLAAQHNGGILYAHLSDSGVSKPRLAVQSNTASKYLPLFPEHLVSWLKFDESVTKDELGNTWSVTDGSPALTTDNAISGKALKGGRIELGTPVMLGGADFTVDFWFLAHSNGWQTAAVWRAGESTGGGAGGLVCIQKASAGSLFFYYGVKTNNPASVTPSKSIAHYAIVYQHATRTIKLYQNGKAVASKTVTIERNAHASCLGHKSGVTTIDNFRIWDGVALWTSDFTPPTAADYA